MLSRAVESEKLDALHARRTHFHTLSLLLHSLKISFWKVSLSTRQNPDSRKTLAGFRVDKKFLFETTNFFVSISKIGGTVEFFFWNFYPLRFSFFFNSNSVCQKRVPIAHGTNSFPLFPKKWRQKSSFSKEFPTNFFLFLLFLIRRGGCCSGPVGAACQVRLRRWQSLRRTTAVV